MCTHVAIGAATISKMWRELCISKETGSMKTFPCSLGKETLSNLDQIHLAPPMFSPLLRLTSWKAFLKQDYRRNTGESQISVCVLHHCSLCCCFFCRGLSRTVRTAWARCSWGRKKINPDVVGVRNIKTNVLTYQLCELWKGCELDTVSRDLVLIYPSSGRGLNTWTQNKTTWQPGSLTFRHAVASAKRSIYWFTAPHYFDWMI